MKPLSTMNPLLKSGIGTARLRWGLSQVVRKLGRLEILACLMLIALSTYHLFIAQPELEKLEHTRSTLQKALAQPLQATSQTHAITLQDVQKMKTAEQAYFVLDAFSKHGMHRKSATYRRDSEVKGQLQRLSIGIAMSGTYDDFRRALQSIVDVPMLRVEHLLIERKDIGDVNTDIDLRISLLGADA